MHSEWPQEQPPLQCSDGPHGSIHGFGLGGAGGGARDMGCGAAVGRAVPLRYPCAPSLAGFCIINGTMGTPRLCAYLRGSTCTCGIASRNPDEISSASVETGRPIRRRRGTSPRACSSSRSGSARSSTSAVRSRPEPLPPAMGADCRRHVHDSTVRQPIACAAQHGAPADNRSQVRSRGPPTARREPIAAAESV